MNGNVVTAADTEVVDDQELNDLGILSIAVGLTWSASTQDLISMSPSSNDWVRFTGSYRDLQGKVSSVLPLVCIVQPTGQFPPVECRLLEHFNHTDSLCWRTDRCTVCIYVTWTALSDYTGPVLLCSTVFHFQLFFSFF